MLLTQENSNFIKNLANNKSLYEFKTELYNNQKLVLDEIQYNKCLFHLPTAFGKTIIGCKLASFIFGKVLVLIPSVIIYKQWEETINKYCPINNITLCMQIKFSKDIRNDFKCVIIDECHKNNRLIFDDILPKLKCKYIFGFSATPNLIDFFYQIIIRETKKEILINIVKLPFKPKIKYKYFGGKKRLDYSYMMKTLIDNEERTQYIFDKIKNIYEEHINEKILILSNNIKTISSIMKLNNDNYKMDYLCGNKNNWDDKCNILIGTYQKLEIGFNSDIFKILILLDNRKDIRQSEGRIRIKSMICYIFIDNHGVFESHLRSNIEWLNSRNLLKI